MIKTAKISKVSNKKEWKGPKGTIIYHDLVMDNGDKINIGKKKDQIEGWDITYEIVGDVGQQEYVKAKAAQLEGGFTPSKSGGNFSKDKNKQITELACLKAAASISAAYITQGHKVTPEDVISLKNTFTQDILREDKPVEKPNNNPNTLSNGEVVLDDMPF